MRPIGRMALAEVDDMVIVAMTAVIQHAIRRVAILWVATRVVMHPIAYFRTDAIAPHPCLRLAIPMRLIRARHPDAMMILCTVLDVQSRIRLNDIRQLH